MIDRSDSCGVVDSRFNGVPKLRRCVLGDEHPDTLTSISNLASTLQAEGDLPGAVELEEKVLEVRRGVLGDEHPHTTLSAWNLSYALARMGEVEAAHRILSEHVLWLLDRDPTTLGAGQRMIREKLSQRFDLS